jgi:subtilisin family serine protease
MKSGTLKILVVAVVILMLIVPVSANSAPDEATGVYIVRLKDAPLASYRGGIAGLEATSPRVTGARKLDVNSPASVAYLDYLAQKRTQLLAAMEDGFGHEVEILFQYDVAYNGMAVRLTSQEAFELAAFSGVADVQPEFVRYPTTEAGPAWIGAPGIWDGSAVPGGMGTMGEGVIAGVIDTGQNLDNPSFADIGGDGYDHDNPLGPNTYVGLCLDDPGTWVCNDKFIGYYIFTGEDHEDTDGHGSHTASTVAGNVVLSTTATMIAPTTIYSATVSGVAPHANIIGYDACDDDGGCPGAALIAAINQATADRVDVINYSIGGGPSNPWLDADALAFLAAQDAGVIPVTSAGNNGPDPGTIGSPGDAPWLLAVAASTHNRFHRNSLISMSGGDTPPPDDILGKGLTSGYSSHPIVYAGNFGDPLCGSPFAPGTWQNGEIVVCDRGGGFGRVEKGANVLAGGAGGYVLANAESDGRSLNGDPHVLPAVHIVYEDGVALKDWLASGSGHMAAIAGYTASFDPANGDVMAAFSSRGPSPAVPDVIKPDVTAPGLDIFAAYRDPEDYWIISGTSMSSPHAAGAAALLRALYPGWSPAQIKSALMTTAWTATVVKEDDVTPADPFDIGSGRIDLSKAAQVGLVLDVTTTEYEDANPGTGGEPKALNLPSMADSQCPGTCSWLRTVASTLDTTVSWTAVVTAPPGMTLAVTPSSFDLGALASQPIVVDADVGDLPGGAWVFGQVTLVPDDPSVPEAHFPVAVAPAASPPEASVEPTSLETVQPSGIVVTLPLTITNDGDLPLEWSIYEHDGQAGAAPALVDWFEDFDSYPPGQDLHGVGGWKGWDNNPAYTAFTTDAEAHSAPNSVDILTDADLVHEYGYDAGIWTYTAWQYVPPDFSGESYFILLNTYSDGGDKNWSTQVHFNSDLNLVIADGEAAGEVLPLIRGQWVEIHVEIDLINDIQEFYYNGQLLYQSSWSDGVSGGGALNIAAVDLFANGASTVYYDDLSLVQDTGPCSDVSDIAWVSVSPESGTTQAGASSPVDVSFDSTGFDVGVYTGTLCLSSNAPASRLIPVPVAMTVVCSELTGAAISGPAELLAGETGTYSVTLEPPTATPPFDIEWSNGMTGTATTYNWPEPGDYTVMVTATNCAGTSVVTDTLDVTVTQPMHYVYLPIVVKNR